MLNNSKQMTKTMLAIQKAINIVGTQKKLSELCQVTQQTVSDWKKGKIRPSPKRAKMIEEHTKMLVKSNEILPDFAWAPEQPQRSLREQFSYLNNAIPKDYK